jgi:hypothetical protein
MHSTNWKQSEIIDFVKTLDPNIQLGNRSILAPKELDLYSNKHSIAIEFNGLYWHSSLCGNNITKNYHLNKTTQCEAQNIRLIHVFQDQWDSKRNIVKSIISSAFGYAKTIYARKCYLRLISSSECNLFLQQNHIQGADKSSIRIGLIFDEELVSVMTFGKSRFDKNVEWELYRLCNKLGIRIVGGAGKMFQHFIRNYDPRTIITYSDRSLFSGGVYESIGFTFVEYTTPAYSYVNTNTGCKERLNRMRFQKHKLSSILPIFDSSKSETDNMTTNGYGRIWDCGNRKYIWKKQ